MGNDQNLPNFQNEQNFEFNSENSANSKNSDTDKVWLPLSNDWNAERLTQLKNLFPDLFSNEGKLNIEELKKIIDPQSVEELERYEFRWYGKSEAKRNAYTPSKATFIFDEQRSLNPSQSENIIIEGENLEVLKLLSTAYREQIKCIYIDPPYNTGKDFVYSDNFTEDKKPYWEQTGVTENGLKIDTNVESDGRYHSNWLNMIYSRLLIARTLLRQDGVIFISIDDNEVHNLRKLCDEVFGEENFIACLPTIMNLKGNNDEFGFAGTHEYTLVFAKQIDSLVLFEFPLNEEELEEWEEDAQGLYKQGANLKATGANAPREKRKNLFFPIYIDTENNIYVTEDDMPPSIYLGELKKILPITNNMEMSWRWSKNKFNAEKHNLIVSRNGDIGLYKKQRPSIGDLPSKKPKTIFYKPEYSSGNGTEVLKKLIGERFFNNPKPLQLIKDFLTISTTENDCVLDFFGGSGTTGQAIMELNKEDGGNHKYILVQLPEATDKSSEAFKAGYKKISDITIERNKRVIENIIAEKKAKEPELFQNGEKEAILKSLGFKVFKLVKSNFPRVEWAPEAEKTEEENILSLKKYIAEKEAQLHTVFNRDELITEILLKKGFTLNYKIEKLPQFTENEVFFATDERKECWICLDILIQDATVEYLKKGKNMKFICLERALNTTRKYNLKHYLGDLFSAF